MYFLQEPHGVTTQKTPFFIVTAVNTSNLTAKDWLKWMEVDFFDVEIVTFGTFRQMPES
jgi:hypothetical protein